MRRFINTKLIRTVQEISQKGIIADTEVLENECDEFIQIVLDESATCKDRVAYRNALVYTRSEFAGLMAVSKKK